MCRLGICLVLAGCSARPLDLPEPGDLASADLAKADLANADLAKADLAKADFARADLSDLAKADMSDLSEADLSDLAKADLSRVDLTFFCGFNDVLTGAACVKRSCQAGDDRLDCLLPDGGVGHCLNFECSTIDVFSDPNNCGARGGVCPPGATCNGGFCTARCTSSNCPAGLSCDPTSFFDGCDLKTCDGNHDYQVCQSTLSGSGFANTCCGKKCVELHDDNQNCGWCGHVCPGGAACIFGVCEVDCGQLPDNSFCYQGGGYCCHGKCVLYLGANDPKNCNGCGAICPGASTCRAWCTASCFDPAHACAAGQGCVVDLTNSPFCAATSCSGLPRGTLCASFDADGLSHRGSCCGSGCSDLDSDAANCGACGRACPAAEICLNGACAPATNCRSDSTPCLLANGVAGSCCGGRCADLHSEDQNCGGCALACPSGSTCQPFPSAMPNAQCQDTTTGAPAGCGNTNIGCPPASCAGLADDTPCASGICCQGQCVDAHSLTHCGSCGHACPAGSRLCANRDCIDNRAGILNCSAANPCPDGTACTQFYCFPVSPPICARHQCFITSCQGISDGVSCAFGPGSLPGTCCAGQCVSTLQDPANCGACGRDCGGGLCLTGICQDAVVAGCSPPCADGQVCAQVAPLDFETAPTGVCVGPVCGLIMYNNPQLNTGFCLAQDGQLGFCCAGGVCADLAADPQNCGGCGLSCGGQACVHGGCAGALCDVAAQGGFCGGPSDLFSLCCGARCLDTSADNANCGGCAVICSGGKTCQGGVCK